MAEDAQTASPTPGRSVEPAENREPGGRLTHRQLSQILGISLVALSIMAIGTAGVIASWLSSSADDSASWANVQGQVHSLDGLGSQGFRDSQRPDVGTSSAVVLNGDRIATAIAELGEVVVSMASESQWTDHEETLLAANEALTAAEIDVVQAIEAGARIEDLRVLVEAPFGHWRESLTAADQALTDIQASAVQYEARRADLALLAVGIIAIVTLIGLAAVARSIQRAQAREDSLVAAVATEKELLQTILGVIPEDIAWKDRQLRLLGCNPAMGSRFVDAGSRPPFGGRMSDSVDDPGQTPYIAAVEEMEEEVISTGKPVQGYQMAATDHNGNALTEIRSIAPLRQDGETVGVVSTALDITEAVELERSLARSSRLESIGQLSSGIAHEINTPVQFVSDNLEFVNTSFGQLTRALAALESLVATYNAPAIAAIRKEEDLDFVLDEMPDALDQSREGLGQIAKIVRAMKDFAHPGGDFGPSDVNRMITSTVDVSRNEWKYHAEMELDLEESLPQPHCDVGQIKQVLLNLIVNSSHAIADRETRDRGKITISTFSDEATVSITVADTGVGISDETQGRMFERFFTTKEIGRGSGQGLAIAHEAIAAHGGTIDVDSKVGAGSTFTVTIPINPPNQS